MAKRTRKPPVRPEVRREWLRRNEENGESPPQIATKDRFDVRTVRTQIDLAKQEREVREARSIVLRNALESHYRDLCKYAEDISEKITVTGEGGLSSRTGDPHMEAALRQHLPRSPIWQDLSKWERLGSRLAELEDAIGNRLKDELEHDPRLSKVLAAGETQAVAGLVAALAFQAKAWAQEWKGLSIKDDLKVKPTEAGISSAEYGFAQMGKVQDEHVRDIREVLADFEAKITKWDQFENMGKSFTELKRVTLALKDELAVITHKRIVSGKCKYCPI